MTVASTSLAVACPRTTSSSRMTLAGLKKCSADARPGGRWVKRGDLVDVQRRGVGGEDRARFRHCVELSEHRLLHRELLEHRLDDEIGAAQIVVGQGRLNSAMRLLEIRRATACSFLTVLS